MSILERAIALAAIAIDPSPPASGASRVPSSCRIGAGSAWWTAPVRAASNVA